MTERGSRCFKTLEFTTGEIRIESQVALSLLWKESYCSQRFNVRHQQHESSEIYLIVCEAP